MRLMKVLAIAAGILIVFIVLSALWHILYLIGVGIVIVGVLFLAFKAWEQYKRAQQRHEERRDQRAQRRDERSTSRSIEARPPQYPGTTGTPAGSARQDDIDEELARLRRDMR
jgi:membrane protein implicated in regulation of membrane protease activity